MVVVEEGERVLARLIRERGLLKGFVAERLGMHPSALSNVLAGRRALSLEEAVRASRLFGVPVEAFVEGFGDE